MLQEFQKIHLTNSYNSETQYFLENVFLSYTCKIPHFQRHFGNILQNW